MADKFYAVKTGLKPGIYRSWAECEPLVKGFPNARFKSFLTEREAVEFMGDDWCKKMTVRLIRPKILMTKKP